MPTPSCPEDPGGRVTFCGWKQSWPADPGMVSCQGLHSSRSSLTQSQPLLLCRKSAFRPEIWILSARLPSNLHGLHIPPRPHPSGVPSLPSQTSLVHGQHHGPGSCQAPSRHFEGASGDGAGEGRLDSAASQLVLSPRQEVGAQALSCELQEEGVLELLGASVLRQC